MAIGLKSILVSVTEGCHVGCAHCGFIGSVRDRETPEDDLAGWVDQICRYGVPVVIFTGGEPFERLAALERGVAAATAAGTPSACFTSSFWATSADVAHETLARLAGLRHLYLSSDVYHQKRVPFANVHHVIDAADRLAIPEVTICITFATEEDRRFVRSHYEHYGARVRFYEERVIPTPFIRRVVAEQDPERGFSPDAYEPTCWVDTPIVNPNGDVFGCHVGKVGAHGNFEDLPYWLGNLRRTSFAAVMAAAASNLRYQFLRSRGPRGVAELFAAYPELARAVGRTGFTGRCDMCFSVLSTKAGREALAEYVTRPEVMDQIDLGLFERYNEPPVEALPGVPS